MSARSTSIRVVVTAAVVVGSAACSGPYDRDEYVEACVGYRLASQGEQADPVVIKAACEDEFPREQGAEVPMPEEYARWLKTGEVSS
jgi:hypothetical protein